MKAVVVGGGFAGTAMACLLAKHGKVTQVTAGFGATAVSSGAVDFLRPTSLDTRDRTKALLKFMGMPFRSAPAEFTAVPTEAGTVRRATLVPEFVPTLDEANEWTVLTMPGLFDESRLGLLRQQAVEAGSGAQLHAAPLPFDLPHHPLQAAARVDAHSKDFLYALGPLAEGALLLPPICGVKRRLEIVKEADRLGLQVREMLSHYPSVWGLRHQRSLEEAARSGGVTVIRGAARAEIEGKRVARIEAAGTSLEADLVVLATGKFLGGGLVRTLSLTGRRTFQDSVMGREVAAGELREEAFGPDGHGFFRVGLRVDAEGKVVGDAGPLANVYAIGSAVEGHGPPLAGAGDGIADALRLADVLTEGVAVRAT